MQNIIFWKIPTLRLTYYFYFADARPHFFFAFLPVDQKIKLVFPYERFVVVLGAQPSDLIRQMYNIYLYYNKASLYTFDSVLNTLL